MSSVQIIRTVLINAVKLVIFIAGFYAICAATLRIEEANTPTSKDICDRVKLGMTTDQIEYATKAFEGWQLLRDDGVMVISTGPRPDGPVCRVAIDPHTRRATSKSMGPLQEGDWPTL
jgi:hypothetical protein